MLAFIDDRSIICLMKEQTTKERIMVAAEKIMLENSFHSVGIKQILDTVKVPKGSFYHYFTSKEQFGVEMLKQYMDDTTVEKRRMFIAVDKASDPVQHLLAALTGIVDSMQSDIDKFPCLALKLAAEVSDLSEDMRKELEKGIRKWIAIFVEVFEDAKLQKLLPEDFDSELEAQFLHDLMTGATHRAVINRSSKPIECAVTIIQSRINKMMI